ncbi:MAG: hypothetical protein AB3N11_04785 [Arenibacterium sp.]
MPKIDRSFPTFHSGGVMNGLTKFATIAFVLTTSALLLPGYIKAWRAVSPVEAEFYVTQLITSRARVFDASGKFARLPADQNLLSIEHFSCARSTSARREFQWRGARAIIWDCPVVFTTEAGQYTYVLRLVPDDDPIAKVSSEGYRTTGIDVEAAWDILEAVGRMPKGG